MKIELTRIVEYYEVILNNNEDDPGKYIVEREPLNRPETRYRIKNDKGQKYWDITRPYMNITREIEKTKRNEKALLLKLQGEYLKTEIGEI